MAASELRAEFASAGPSDATLHVLLLVVWVVGLVGVVVVVLGVVVLVVVVVVVLGVVVATEP
jgi:hypothetical protein